MHCFADSDNASKLCTENGGQIVVVENCQACNEFKMVTSCCIFMMFDLSETTSLDWTCFEAAEFTARYYGRKMKGRAKGERRRMQMLHMLTKDGCVALK